MKSETSTKASEELEKAIALELDKDTPKNAEAIVNENTRGLHRSGSDRDDNGDIENPREKV